MLGIRLTLCVVAVFAYFVKGVTGFGNTLVMASLFSFMVSPRLTTPVDLLLSIPTNAFIVWKDRKGINLRIVMPLVLMLLVGAIPGVYLLKTGNEQFLKALLGFVVIGVGIENLTRGNRGQSSKANSLLLTAVGVLSGVLTGLYGIGAPLVAYISRTTTNRSQFRANLCAVFLVDNLFRFFYYLRMGILSREVLVTTAWLLPGVIAGLLVGGKIDAKLDERAVKRAVTVLLLVSGALLVIQNLAR